MEVFKKYKRVQIAELRPVEVMDIESYFRHGKIVRRYENEEFIQDKIVKLNVSEFDLKNGSPKIGDMIARNPNNHNDQWLVSEEYFKNNFKEIEK